MLNHLGEREFTTYTGWRNAIKRIDPDAIIEGDKDIACAFNGDHSQGLGEWDGAIGVVFLSDEEYIPKDFP